MRVVSNSSGFSPAVSHVTCFAGPPMLSRSIMRTTRMRSLISIHKLLVPKLQHQQRPKLMRVIAAASRVLVNQMTNGFGFEVAATLCLVRQNVLFEKAFQFVAEPVTDRHAKSHLASRQIFFRNQPAERTL